MAGLVYLDVCCLKRPFDDQRSPRIQLETTAIATLIDQAERGVIRLVRSPAHVLENERNPREDRRLAAALWLGAAHVQAAMTEKAASRARQLAALGFAALDALHTAFAEGSEADWLATPDDQLIALGRRHREALHVAIANPIHVLERLVTVGEP